MEYEKAKENIIIIERLLTEHKDLNEATTRLLLIDTMLVDCLGWEKSLIEAERYFSEEYSDYELGFPKKRLLVEAKREGIYFEVPAGFSKNKCDLKTIYSLSKDIEKAVEQSIGYCNKRGIPISVVTNGHQYIVFIRALRVREWVNPGACQARSICRARR